jgi:hypothetical protein
MRSKNAKGEEQPPRYLQLGEGELAFAGNHGLLVGNHASWESNDAGDTWTRVASNGETSRLACTAAGCLVDGAQRVGWDLPALQSTEIVRATATPPAEQKPDTTKPVKPKSTPLELTCKVSGKPKTLATANDVSWIDGTTPARWAQVSNTFVGPGNVMLTWADKDTVRETQLLAAKQSTMELRTATDERDDGVVAARFQYARRTEGGKLNPVQVELAWWSPSKPTQVHHANITVKAFRVSRFAFSGRARVVDGGVVFQGGRDDATVHFVHDDGKDETFAAPGIPFSDVARSGTKWVFADSDGYVEQMASSEDGGKTWALRGWAFDPMRSDSGMMTIGGKPVVRASGALFTVAWPVASDPPPAPVVIDLASREPRCDGLVTASTSERERIDDDSIHMELAGTKLAGAERVLHVTQTGKLCTAVLQLEQGNREAYVYPDTGGGWSGWSYGETKDNKTIVEPLTCK